jgi:hypothetical protein
MRHRLSSPGSDLLRQRQKKLIPDEISPRIKETLFGFYMNGRDDLLFILFGRTQGERGDDT